MTTAVQVLESAGAAFSMAVMLPLNPLLRRSYNRAGATEAEIQEPLPGDEIVEKPKQTYTRAITINAPPAQVWTYIVQLGQNRGGFYSYDLLENIAGCQVHTLHYRVPELQHIQVGDLIRFGKPEGYPVQKVVDVVPQKYLVLEGVDPKTYNTPQEPRTSPSYVKASWMFYLKLVGNNQTRLITRSRLDYADTTMMTIIWRVTEVLNYVMERKTLHTWKSLAERDALLLYGN